MLHTVTISEAQRDVRTVFLGGFAGQLASSAVWLASAATATWRSPRAGMEALVVAGFFIFPMTRLLLYLMGRPSSLPKGHPMNGLAMQAAFVLPPPCRWYSRPPSTGKTGSIPPS